MVSEVVSACRQYKLVPYRIKGFDHFEKEVIYLPIQPSETFEDLRRDIAVRLLKFTHPTPYDKHFSKSLHVTIVWRNIVRKFDKIWHYIQRKEQPDINQYLLRVTIKRTGLFGGWRILCEYDLLQQKLLTYREAQSRAVWETTLAILRQILPGYKPDSDEEVTWLEKLWKRLKWELAALERRTTKYFGKARKRLRGLARRGWSGL
jgi:hypothetical protein